MKLKSTLPSLFKSHQLANRSNESPVISKSTPHRQGGIYTLNLTISFNDDGHKINIQKEYPAKMIKLTNRNKNKQKGRSKSIANSQQLDRFHITSSNPDKQINLDRYATIQNANKTVRRYSLRNNQSEGISKSIQINQPKSFSKLQQISSTQVLCKHIQQQIYLLQKQLQTIPVDHNRLHVDLYESQNKIKNCIQSIETNTKQKITKLRQKMSQIRQQTRMQQKKIKQQAQWIKDDLNSISQVMKGVQEHRIRVHNINF